MKGMIWLAAAAMYNLWFKNIGLQIRLGAYVLPMICSSSVAQILFLIASGIGTLSYIIKPVSLRYDPVFTARS